MTDRELLFKVSKGCERSFEHLFNRYNGRLLNYVHQISRSAEVSEEIIQEVFLKIWTGRERLADIHSFQAYLFAMAKNNCLNALRQQAREHQALKNQLEQAHFHIEDDPAGVGRERQLYRLMDEAIGRLPSQQQKVFVLSRHDRLKYAEVAERLSLSRQTVKKYLQLATQAIKDYIISRKSEILLLILYPLFSLPGVP